MRAAAVFVLLCGLAGLAPAETYHGVAVAPDGQRAWVATIETTAVYHTTDFGVTWAPQNIPTVRDFFDIEFIDAQTGWTCGRIADIWHTSDGGENWIRQNLGGPKFATRIRFIDANYGWAAGGEAILVRTADGGGEWQMDFFPNPPFPGDTVDFQGLALVDSITGYLVAGRFPEGDTFARGQGFICRHTAGGSTELLRRDTEYDFYDVAIAGAQNIWVVGGNDQTMRGVVLHSTDAGATWAEQPLPVTARFLRGVAFAGPSKGWACGRNGTIVHTSDGGQTWVQQATGVDTTLFDIEFADELRGMVAGNSVVLYTTDGGATWLRGFGGVQEMPAAAPRAALKVERNPAAGSVRFLSDGGAPREEVRIFDATGNAVAVVSGGAGVWDGRMTSGRRAATGLYFAESGRGAAVQAVRFVLVAQ
ncbi:MAG: YCF48-related protein [bacterium]